MYLCHTFCELGGDAARLGARATSTTSSSPIPSEVARRHQPGLRHAGGLRRRGATTRASATLAYRGPTRRRLADAARDDRPQPARRVPRREPRRRRRPGTTSPTRRSPRRRRTRSAGAPQLTDPARLPASCRPNRGPEGRAAVPRQPLDHDRPAAAAVRTRATVNAYGPLLRRVHGVPADPRPRPEPRRRELLPPRRRCSAWSTRSTASAEIERASALRGGACDRS